MQEEGGGRSGVRRLRSGTERPAAITRIPTGQPERGGHADNLPAPFASFVGRARQLSEVGRLLDVHRLVTLAGAPGVGKTRLAVHLAGRLRAAYADGAWLVDLTRVDEPALAAS